MAAKTTEPDNPMKTIKDHHSILTKTGVSKKARAIYLGIDSHRRSYVVRRKIDGRLPQASQRLSLEALLDFVRKQFDQAEEVFACYEASALGYWLYRRLKDMGVEVNVVAPEDWDSRKKRVKTDKRDALALVQRLYAYVQGDRYAFSVVFVPSEDEEDRRMLTRQREQLMEHRKRLERQGGSYLLYKGYYDSPNSWWRPRVWKKLQRWIDSATLQRLQTLRVILLEVETQLKELDEQIEAQVQDQVLPTGVGALSWVTLSNEVVCWQRFNNRREVSSLTGLCPSEYSTGDASDRRQGSINKHGNPRMRRILVQMAWRMFRYQPDYRLVRKWGPKMAEASSKGYKAMKKRIIVAFAREMAVDLWRLANAQTSPEKLGLELRIMN